MSFHAGAHPMSSSVFYDNPNISRSASVSVKPKPQAIRAKSQTSVPSRVVSPPENRRDSFDFSVPSLPPRLANFGRKISQMRDDFIDSLDDAPETKHKSLDSTRESLKQLSAVEHSHSDVPGMGDEPVMCPFCNKPLPPVLFHQPSPKKPSRPGMRRPATSVGVTAPFGKSSTAPTTRNNSVTLDSPPVKPLSSLSSSSSSSGKLMDPAEVKPRPKPLKDVTKAGLASEIMRSPDPAVTSESLRPQVMDADKLNHAAAEINVSEDDLRRWSSLAGVPLPPIERPSSAPPSTTTDLSSPVPHLGKPPPDQGSSPGGRFGFFRKTSAKPKLPKSEDDSDDDDTGTGSGYSKLLGAGSDDEDATIHAEPKGMTDDEGPDKDTVEDKDKDEEGITIEANGVPIAAPVAQVPEVEPPKVDNEELRKVLQEVLVKISEISKSHSALLTSQSTLLTSLKIARSNLAMAEANTEMLEAQIKQTKAATPRSATAGPATPISGPGSRAVSNTVNGSGGDKTTPKASERGSSERVRPNSLYTSLPDTNPNGEKSGWGFWNGGKKRLAGLSESMSGLSTPTGEKSGFDFMSSVATAGPYSVALPPEPRYNRRSSDGFPGKSASVDDLSSGAVPAPLAGESGAGGEVGRLRQAYTTAQTRMDSMSKELTELKKGKVEMEAELENLSQALFEEANKMVADERRKRAEMEEALKEAKAEKDALRSTIIVLGGGGEDDAASTASTDTTEVGSFEPRDLDKHYEALRRSIHHVADGAEGVILSPKAVDKMPTLPEGTESAMMGHSNSDPGVQPEPLDSAPTARNSLERPGVVDGSIADIQAVASNPQLEAAVDLPEPIPEDQPVANPLSSTTSDSDARTTPEEGDMTAGAAGRVILDAEPNPWDDITPQNGPIDRPAETDGPKDGDMSDGADVGLKNKGVEDLDRLMQKLKDEELGNVVPVA